MMICFHRWSRWSEPKYTRDFVGLHQHRTCSKCGKAKERQC